MVASFESVTLLAPVKALIEATLLCMLLVTNSLFVAAQATGRAPEGVDQ